MIKLFITSIVMFLAIYPLAYLRKNVITENGLYGVFLGNYIYYIHYFVMIVFVLTLVHYLIIPVPKKVVLCVIPVFLMLVGVIGYYNYRTPVIVYNEISIAKSAHVDNTKVAFVADFHLTTTSNKKLFLDMAQKINEQHPDIVILGGDILQNSHTKVTQDYNNVFSAIKSKYGTYMILGNHEYYGNDVEENLKYLQSLGIKILRDEVLKIDGINFIGRDDIRRDYVAGERKSLQELYSENNISMDEPAIVIDHNPKNIKDAIDAKADIQLSAHTHAGQFFPYNLLLKSRMPNAYGYKEVEGLHTIVTSGVGVGFWKIVGPWVMPYRLGTNSEINIINIKFDNH